MYACIGIIVIFLGLFLYGGERRLAHLCGGLRTGVLRWIGAVCWGRIEQVYRCTEEGADMYAVWGISLPQVHVGWRRGSCIGGRGRGD